MGHQYAVVDVETTGLGPQTNRIVELAVVITDESGHPFWEWSSRFNPEGPVGATHIHGITDAEVADAPAFRDLVPYVSELLARRIVVAHNVDFDESFLRAEFLRAGWELPLLPTVCTLEGGRVYMPALGSWTLSSCCSACAIPHVGQHSALGDARAVAGLLETLLTRTDDRGAWLEWADAAAAAAAIAWPTAPTLAPQLAPPPPPSSAATWAAERYRKPKQRSPRLLDAFDQLVLDDVLDEGAPESTVAYLTLLSDVLTDGVITDDERAALEELAHAYSLTETDRATAHGAFLHALAHLAILDGSVSRQERADLTAIAELLGQPSGTVAQLIDQAEVSRNIRLSHGLAPLPDDWSLGEPLRVGDKVVVTGCYDHGREAFEARSEELGVRVMSAVSSRTALLVSDGAMDGGKLADARLHETRVVHPTEFLKMLDHLQPARPANGRHEKPVKPTTTTMLLVSSNSAQPGEVRQWAKESGYLVGDRGSIPRAIVQAYLAARETA